MKWWGRGGGGVGVTASDQTPAAYFLAVYFKKVWTKNKVRGWMLQLVINFEGVWTKNKVGRGVVTGGDQTPDIYFHAAYFKRM